MSEENEIVQPQDSTVTTTGEDRDPTPDPREPVGERMFSQEEVDREGRISQSIKLIKNFACTFSDHVSLSNSVRAG